MTGTPALNSLAVCPGELMFVSSGDGSTASSNAREAELLESRLARFRLDQAEQNMNSLKSRIDYLERRASSSIGATERELEDLMRTRDDLSANAARVAQLSSRFERAETEESDPSGDWDGWNDY